MEILVNLAVLFLSKIINWHVFLVTLYVCMYVCICVTLPGQTKSDTDLKLGTHTPKDLI